MKRIINMAITVVNTPASSPFLGTIHTLQMTRKRKTPRLATIRGRTSTNSIRTYWPENFSPL